MSLLRRVRAGARHAIAPVALLAAAGATARAQDRTTAGAPSPIARAYEALQRERLGTADSLFRVGARSADPAIRRGGLEGAALVAWRYRADPAEGDRLLRRALAEPVDSALTLAAIARLRESQGAHRAAVRAALTAADIGAAHGQTDVARRALRIAVTAAVEPRLVERIDGGEVAAADRPSRDTLAIAVARLDSVVRGAPGHADDSHALLLGALALDQGATALRAWHSYFLVRPDDGGAGPLASAARLLGATLPSWSGEGASAAARERVVDALRSSGLVVAAALVAHDRGAPVPSGAMGDVVTYAAFCRTLTRATNDYYRRTLLDRTAPQELTRTYVRLTRALWPRLDWPDGAPRYFPAAADSELSRRFGAVIHFGRSAGYFDLHYGHRVLEEARTIAQYGHRATLRFIAMDGVVSDGFQSWAWDERGSHAGWQVGRVIVQVRPALADNPLVFWELLTDSATVRSMAFQIARDSAADWARVAKREVAFVPGVELRLLRDGAAALRDSLRASGLEGDSLRSAFVAEAARAIREASIFAHEGRHAIDHAIGVRDEAELELRAKLSEIAFAPRPKLVLGGIVHASIGDATPHGRANERVLHGVLAWMRAHASEIAGLDTGRALLPQLPLLTDSQLRAAFRSMDPLARGASAEGS